MVTVNNLSLDSLVNSGMAPPMEVILPSSKNIKLASEVPSKDYQLLADILNPAWGWMINADPRIMEMRLKSGHPIFVAYDGQQPKVILETTLLKTGGELANIPPNYWLLTHMGYWGPVPRDFDSVMCVDLTKAPNADKDLVKMTINHALGLFKGENSYGRPIPNIGTYSPDDPKVIGMHINFGAEDTEHIQSYARYPLEFLHTTGSKSGLDLAALNEFTAKMQITNPRFGPHMYRAHITAYAGFGFSGHNVLNNGSSLK